MRPISVILSLVLVASPLSADAGRRFTVGGVPIAEADILDARALPTLSGKPSIMITLTDTATSKVAQTARNQRNPSIALNGKPLSPPEGRPALQDNVVEVVGEFQSIEEAARVAKSISGKDPLPDSLDEEGL